MASRQRGLRRAQAGGGGSSAPPGGGGAGGAATRCQCWPVLAGSELRRTGARPPSRPSPGECPSPGAGGPPDARPGADSDLESAEFVGADSGVRVTVPERQSHRVAGTRHSQWHAGTVLSTAALGSANGTVTVTGPLTGSLPLSGSGWRPASAAPV